MTTTLKPSGQPVVARPPVPVEEHPDLRALPRWPEAPAAGEPTARRRWWTLVAVGLVALLVGLAAGYAWTSWRRSDEITRLENQVAAMSAVPYAGFKSVYSAPREHQALADTLAAGGAQGSWQTASNGTRTFLYYPST